MKKFFRTLWSTLVGCILLIAGFLTYLSINDSKHLDYTEFEQAHQQAIEEFIETSEFGMTRFSKSELENGWSAVIDGQTYKVKDIHLIGTTTEYGDRYFESDSPLKKQNLSTVKTRELSEWEKEAMDILKTKKQSFVHSKINRRKLRVIAPVSARYTCLDCHDAEIGDFLGAFDYQLLAEK